MKNVLKYAKDLGIFSFLEIFIIFICSILNLIFASSSVTTIILLLFNLLLFTYFSFRYGKISKLKGIISGLIIGLVLIFYLFLINVIFYDFNFNINKIVYYAILLLSAVLGGIIGKNKRKEV